MKMKHNVYTVWDEVIGAYSSPVLALNNLHMERILEAWNKVPNHPLMENAVDKTLFEIGEFNDETGRIQMHLANKRVTGLHEFLNKLKQIEESK